jgi:hypothetical protein
MAISHNNLNTFEAMLEKAENEGELQVLRNMIDRREKELRKAKKPVAPFTVRFQKQSSKFYRDGFPILGMYDTIEQAKAAIEKSKKRGVTRWHIHDDSGNYYATKIKNWIEHQ